MCAFSHLHRCALLLAMALPRTAWAEPEIGTSELADVSIGHASTESAPSPAEDGTRGAASDYWMQELERRVFSLAAPVLESPNTTVQTSPRYAAYELDDAMAPMLAWAWVLPSLPAEERATLELVGEGLTRSDSQLARELVDRALASEVRARVFEREGRTVFAVLVLGTPRSMNTNLAEIVEGALDSLALAGPTRSLDPIASSGEAVRLAVNRYLSPQRRAMVELLPRNAPDPALSVRPPSERSTLVRPQAVARAGAARMHSVKRGDTLLGIARRYDVSVRELVTQNGIEPGRPIRLGQKLLVPARKAARRQTGSARVPSRKRTRNRP